MNFELFKKLQKKSQGLSLPSRLDVTVGDAVSPNGPKPMRCKLVELRRAVESAMAFGGVSDPLLDQCEVLLEGVCQVEERLRAQAARFAQANLLLDSAKAYARLARCLDELLQQLETGGIAFAGTSLDKMDHLAQGIEQLMQESQAA